MPPASTATMEARPPIGTPKSSISTDLPIAGTPLHFENSFDSDVDLSPFAPSGKVTRTPPQQTTLSPIPSAPAKPKASQQYNTRNEPQTPSTHSDFTKALNNIRNIASELKVQGANIDIKARLIQAIDSVIVKVDNTSTQLEHHNEISRISNIENDIKEIKKALLESPTSRPKTWAQVASSGTHFSVSTDIQIEMAKRERMERIKTDKAKTELSISLRSATDETQKKKLEDMTEQAIAEEIQSTVRKHVSDAAGFQILKVSKTNRSILKIQCSTEADKEKLASLDWEHYIKGAKQIKPMHGIVIHGVPKQDLDITSLSKAKEQLEEKNNIIISKVMPLIKQPRNPFAPTHSIVIFTETPMQANKCIIDGILINYHRHAANRFAPQYQIMQCFKCHRYGHRADTCNAPASCGKCSEKHTSKECFNKELCCVLCKGSHLAWSHECPQRQKEIERLKLLRATLPSTFPC